MHLVYVLELPFFSITNRGMKEEHKSKSRTVRMKAFYILLIFIFAILSFSSVAIFTLSAVGLRRFDFWSRLTLVPFGAMGTLSLCIIAVLQYRWNRIFSDGWIQLFLSASVLITISVSIIGCVLVEEDTLCIALMLGAVGATSTLSGIAVFFRAHFRGNQDGDIVTIAPEKKNQ